jgi:hypothetical protein
MWGLLAGLLGLTALDAVVSRGGPARFGQATAVVGGAIRWLTDATVPGIPDLSASSTAGSVPAPGQANPNLTPADYQLTIAEILGTGSQRASDIFSTFGIKVVGTPNPNLTPADQQLTIGQIEGLPVAQRNDVLSSFGLAQG